MCVDKWNEGGWYVAESTWCLVLGMEGGNGDCGVVTNLVQW